MQLLVKSMSVSCHCLTQLSLSSTFSGLLCIYNILCTFYQIPLLHNYGISLHTIVQSLDMPHKCVIRKAIYQDNDEQHRITAMSLLQIDFAFVKASPVSPDFVRFCASYQRNKMMTILSDLSLLSYHLPSLKSWI